MALKIRLSERDGQTLRAAGYDTSMIGAILDRAAVPVQAGPGAQAESSAVDYLMPVLAGDGPISGGVA